MWTILHCIVLASVTQIDCGIPNIDLKTSSVPSNPEYGEDVIGQQPKPNKNKFTDKATLDLSGCLDVHVLSPTGPNRDEEERNTIPLIKFGKSPQIPVIRLGFLYDFGSRWYGVTKIFSTLSWSTSRKSTNNINDNRMSYYFRPKIKNAQLKFQKDLTNISQQDDSFASIKINSNAFNEVINVSTEGHFITSTSSFHVTSTIQTCIRRRLSLIYILIHKVGNYNNISPSSFSKESLFKYKVPKSKEQQQQEQSSWIPDLQLALDGRVISSNEMTFQIQKNILQKIQNYYKNPKIQYSSTATRTHLPVGLRLVMSRKIFDNEGWLSPSSSSVEGTTFKLEMSVLDLFGTGSSILEGLTTLVLESNLEDLKSSSQCSVIHEALTDSF